MHIGDKIRARAKELKIGPTELGRLIKTSKQNVYGIYLRQTIDTGLLTKLSKALEFDFFVYYSKGGSLAVNMQEEVYKRRKNIKTEETDDTDMKQAVKDLKKDLNDLREKYELLKELYELKTGKKVPGSM